MRPKLLDLFCGAGGAATGYYRAGFEIFGVDNKVQKNYPFKRMRADAINVLDSIVVRGKNSFFGKPDFIHASPPCQRYSVASKSWNGAKDTHPDLILIIRDLLKKTGLPYIIENVVGSPLINPIILCGTMFPGLRVIRHRLFESNVSLVAPSHPKHPLCFTKDKRKPHCGRLDEMKDFVMVNGGGNCSKVAALDAMGIGWMTKMEVNEAIPPAYTEYIGRQLLNN